MQEQFLSGIAPHGVLEYVANILGFALGEFALTKKHL